MRPFYPTFQVYLAFAKQSFQKRMQYRVANLAGLTTNFFFLLVHIFVYTAFYAARTDPLPLDLNEIITYFVLCQVFFMLMPFWGTNSEATHAIKDGNVALQLTKPVDFQSYWFADECGRACYYLILRGVPTFIIGAFFFKVQLPHHPTALIAFTASMALAAFMSAAITITIFSTAFWTLDTTGISGLSYAVITLFSGMLVPLALWPERLAAIGDWLPFAGLIDVPFSIYLGKISGTALWLALGKQFGWVLIFIGLGRLLLHRGFSRLVIQGG